MKDKYGIDGIMIGRAAIGYPWIFNEIKHYLKTGIHLSKPNINDRVIACKQHLKHSIEWKGETLGVAEMKRHYTNYFKGIPHFKDYRIQMVTSESPDKIHETLNVISRKFSDFSF